MTLMPRALSPALPPVENTQQKLDYPRAGSVGERCYLQYLLRKYSLLLCVSLPKHGSEHEFAHHSSKTDGLGQITPNH